jgi:hypothetical protein
MHYPARQRKKSAITTRLCACKSANEKIQCVRESSFAHAVRTKKKRECHKSVRSSTLIGLDFSLTTLIGITGKRKQLITCTHRKQEQSSDYAQQDLSEVIKRSSLDMERL